MFLMSFVIGVINAVLSYKIRQKAKLTYQKQEREKMKKVHSNLLDALSHELRTPLSVIVLGADKLQSDPGGMENTTLPAEIGEAAMRLNSRLENIFAASRIDAGSIKIKHDFVNIYELVHEAVRKAEENEENRHIGVNIPQGIPDLKTDKLILQQLLTQLLNTH